LAVERPEEVELLPVASGSPTEKGDIIGHQKKMIL
jgi:hypothetical protein